jgi:1-acyl-sn-glycerol-3-phosphate acyltransferase
VKRSQDRPNVLQRQMIRLARLLCRVFYEQVEVAGTQHIPASGPVLLCANHTNAIADAIVIVAVYPGLVRPLARSGLFRIPGLRRLLQGYGAVPVSRGRRIDSPDGVGNPGERNARMFARCHAALAEEASLLIFPEGQSHTDPFLRPFKTGAARIALGARRSNGRDPCVIPVGLTFTRKGRFRGSALVSFGAPVPLPPGADENDDEAVRALTRTVEEAVAGVTLNTESWEQLDFLKRVERFVALRRGRYRRGTLDERCRALRRLAGMERRLRAQHPEVVEDLVAKIAEFEQLCARAGVRDYHLTVRVTPWLLIAFFLRALFVLLLVLPVGLWGWLNAVVPFLLTRHLARAASRDRDQYDTAKMGFGALFFIAFWWAQTAWVHDQLGGAWALAYLVSLPVSAGVALLLVKERRRLKENLRALIGVILGRGNMRAVLEARRAEIEAELATLVRRLKQRWHDRDRRPAP